MLIYNFELAMLPILVLLGLSWAVEMVLVQSLNDTIFEIGLNAASKKISGEKYPEFLDRLRNNPTIKLKIQMEGKALFTKRCSWKNHSLDEGPWLKGMIETMHGNPIIKIRTGLFFHVFLAVSALAALAVCIATYHHLEWTTAKSLFVWFGPLVVAAPMISFARILSEKYWANKLINHVCASHAQVDSRKQEMEIKPHTRG